MNTSNPYTTPLTSADLKSNWPLMPQRIAIGPIEALNRGYQLLGDQYWLFLGTCLVGVFIGAAVPLGILMGPMMVGIFYCLIEREQGRRFEFNALFRGFEQFWDSLIVMIAAVVTSMALVLPLVVIYLAILFWSTSSRGEPNLGIMMGGMAVYMLLVTVASIVSYLPFSFCFQLIADKRMTGLDAIKLSARAVWHNLGSMIAFSATGGLISLVLTLMCYVPVFFFLPIWFSAAFVIYREAFPEEIVDAQMI